jgi:hypothetical protein
MPARASLGWLSPHLAAPPLSCGSSSCISSPSCCCCCCIAQPVALPSRPPITPVASDPVGLPYCASLPALTTAQTQQLLRVSSTHHPWRRPPNILPATAYHFFFSFFSFFPLLSSTLASIVLLFLLVKTLPLILSCPSVCLNQLLHSLISTLSGPHPRQPSAPGFLSRPLPS